MLIADKAQVGTMSLTIPRLTKPLRLRLTKAESQKVSHYMGPVKVKPPGIAKTPCALANVGKLRANLTRSNMRYAAYFSQLPMPDAIEFSGYNAKEDRQEEQPQSTKTIFVFGPLLNSRHPDTLLTTMQYLLQSLQSFGMKYAHYAWICNCTWLHVK